jgi:Trypsin-co-occurring domain 2
MGQLGSALVCKAVGPVSRYVKRRIAMQSKPPVRVPYAAVYLAVVSLAFAAPASLPAQTTTADNRVAVEELLGQVQDALGLAETNAPTGHARLDSVTLELKTVAARVEGGRIRFFIFQFGSETETTSTSTITLTLSRPEVAKVRAAELLAPPPFVSGLKDLIVAAWEAVNAGRDRIEGLQPTKVSCEISFGVRRQGNRQLSIAVVPLSVEAGRASSRQAVQTITITFRA